MSEDAVTAIIGADLDLAPVGSAAALPGWFGKIPAVGDFVGRRLPEAFLSRWDQWLQEGMALGERGDDPDWPSTFLTFPIWRFFARPGAFGDSAWAGMLLPSVDRVGRRYPLTIAFDFAGLSQAGGITGLDARLQRYVGLLDAVFEGASLESFEANLAAVAADPPAAVDPLLLVSDGLIHAGLGERMLWWTSNSEGVRTKVLPLTGDTFMELVTDP
jgi:type VI secretion system protein ImpM